MHSRDTPAAGWDCHVHVFDAAAPVRPGHYRPAHRPLAEIERLASGFGIGHLWLVQPSVYGSDNTVMLSALEAGQGRHLGVAVIDPTLDDPMLEHELDRLHRAGVRGLRFNLVSPAGHAGDARADLHRLAPRLHERGWFVQWYVDAQTLPRLPDWQAASGLRFVLDHLAGLHAGLPDGHPAWAAAAALAEGGAWVKLSGWYRLAAAAPYASLEPNIRRVAAMFRPRVLWGSDWPHTSFAPDQMPPYESTLSPIREALGGAALDSIVRDHPRSFNFDKADKA